MFKKITIDGLRGITHLTIDDFKRINLFVGKNNCGKTTILEGLSLITGPTKAELPLKMNRFRGLRLVDENTWSLFFNKLLKNNSIKISAELDKPKEIRNLIIKPHAMTTSKETLMNKDLSDSKDIFTNFSPSIDGLVLDYSFKKGKIKKPQKIITKAISEDQKVQLSKSKNYEELRKGLLINPKNISQALGKRFDKMQINKQTSKIKIVLKQIEPSLENISLGADGIIYFDIGFKRLIPINVMGDGMHRILAIMLAILDTEGGMVFIDEIENGFHHSSQEILWNAVLKSAIEFDVQIFATTHSFECVRAFKSCAARLENTKDDVRLYRIERKKDEFKSIIYDYETLSASLESDWEVR